MAKNEPKDELLQHDFDGIQEYDNQLPGWWKALFYLSILFAIIYLLYFHVFGVGDLSKVEYLREIDSSYVASPADRPGRVFDAYHPPTYAAEAEITPYARARKQEAAYERFKGDMLEAMENADAAQLGRLKESFPKIFEAYTARGGKLPPGAAPAETEINVITEPITDAAILTNAQNLFQTHCTTCHGKAGEGGIGPNLTDEYWLHGGKLPNIIRTITKGVPAKGMISWEKTLAPDEINAVASFILVKLQGTNPPNAKAPQGEKFSE